MNRRSHRATRICVIVLLGLLMLAGFRTLLSIELSTATPDSYSLAYPTPDPHP